MQFEGNKSCRPHFIKEGFGCRPGKHTTMANKTMNKKQMIHSGHDNACGLLL